LVASKLPANAHYFLLNLLSIIRLNFESLNSSLDVLSEQMHEYELLSDNSSTYSSQLNNMGYHTSTTHNMLLIGCSALVLVLAYLFVTLFERMLNMCNMTKSNKCENTMSNIFVRFLMEAYLEMMICAFITLSNPGEAGETLILYSIPAVLISSAIMVTLAYQALSQGKASRISLFFDAADQAATKTNGPLDEKKMSDTGNT
jgi:hypothetical protein